MRKLSIKDKTTALKKLKGWKTVKNRNAITKQFVFDDFPSAFEWMTSIAFYAERENHHPEWLNVYNKVDVILTNMTQVEYPSWILI